MPMPCCVPTPPCWSGTGAGSPGLWGYAISGDLPIVLLQIGDAANIDLVRQLVQAHAYWRLKGLAVDLVIWNEDHAGYRQRLQEQIMGLIASGIEASVIDRPGGIFVRLAEQISSEDRILLQSVARAVITDNRGTLAEQLERRSLSETRVPRLVPTRRYRPEAPPAATPPGVDLQLFNGLGGFSADASEYVITLGPGQTTPAPWANVLANPHFGTVVSESGSAYTWSENAHEFRLTPWHNDPVSDAGGEAIYLRDEETGHVWSPTPLPVPAAMPYVIRHGFGYSVFETRTGGIESELRVYVASDAAVKFSVLKLHNKSGRPRQLSATGYVEWVLGDLRAKSAMHVSSEVAPGSGALYARNPYSTEFAGRVAFFDVDDPRRTVSGDRAEFIGRNGTLQNPAAMKRARLSGKVGAGLDPCAAIQVAFELADGEEREIVFPPRRRAQRRRGRAARPALSRRPGGTRRTRRGAPAMDADARCRAGGDARSGGQCAGQWLADLSDPGLPGLGAQRLLPVGRRFRLPRPAAGHDGADPCRAGRCSANICCCAPAASSRKAMSSTGGIRPRAVVSAPVVPMTTCGCRWRPAAMSSGTGDRAVLDETAHFLEGRPVNPEDDSYYDLPGRSSETATLYEHCVRAIRHGLRFGAHGLPLIGSGDWNDGMDRVGIQGKGESVWLGFFLCDVLRRFSELAAAHGDTAFAEFCRAEGARLHQALEQHGWDGAWYRRAYFDDGTPLGTASGDECRIDSISQSWSVLSGAADPERARLAMQAVDERLVRRG